MSDGFFSRWSRRKQSVREGREPPEPPRPAPPPVAEPAPAEALQRVDPVPEPAAAPEPAAPTLEDTRALTPDSDFRPFVARGVAPEVKNAALKKLFADPHFNVMDGLDTYIDDYSRADPLRPGTLRRLAGARVLGLLSDEDDAAAAHDPAGTGADADACAASVVAQSGSPHELTGPAPQPQGTAGSNCDAHTDLRLQPDHAPPAPGAGDGPA